MQLLLPAHYSPPSQTEEQRATGVDHPSYFITAYCLLPTGHFLLLTAYCLLVTAYFLFPPIPSVAEVPVYGAM